MAFDSLPFLTERKATACPKGRTRLEETVAQRPLTKVDEQTFKKEVRERDGTSCRCCGRRVVRTIARVPEREEIHHIHGRVGDLRFESRAALILCAQDHERVTGRVNQHRLVIVQTRTFQTRQGTFTDARYPVTFKELA